MMIIETTKLNANSLVEILSEAPDSVFPTYQNKTHKERFRELKAEFEEYQVEMGTMAASLKEYVCDFQEKLKEINKNQNEKERAALIADLFSKDPIIYLNRHNVLHTNKVIERAQDIIQCCSNIGLTYYELYFLLCAAVVHDVGNIFGRDQHERRIKDLLDTQCATILPDAVERRIISRIARAHGGSCFGDKDTIIRLSETVSINNCNVREQLLAAILRFADELADDCTRADYAALKTDIITEASKIYHFYSKSLHTVELKKNQINESFEVHLAYEFDKTIAETKFGVFGQEKYLVDEIYERTIKMERERRYCIRYLRPYCPLERIKVNITITDSADEFVSYPITYTLEESGYPATPFATIKDVNAEMKTGTELLDELRKAGMINEQ